MPVITSRDHPLVKQLVRIEGSTAYRRKNGLTLIDGIHLIQIHYSVFGPPRNLIVSQSYFEDKENKRFLNMLFGNTDPKITILDDTLFRFVAPVKTPTGVLALIDVPETQESSSSREVFSVLLESIQDPGNLGSILRSAAAANVRDVYLSKHCTDAWSPKTLRAAMGAHFFLRIHENSDLIQITGKFPGSVIATSIQATKNLFETSLSGPTAFAFGNEGSGLSREMIEAAHDNMAIIMPGKTESLNVAAAAAICFFEKVRQDKATVTRSVGTKQGAGV